jgi:cholesterol transport system auxiliary component
MTDLKTNGSLKRMGLAMRMGLGAMPVLSRELSVAGRRVAMVLLGFGLSQGLSGCSVLGGGGSQPLATFDLAAPESVKSTRTVAAQVLIPEPVALKALDTERILVRPGPIEITYYPGAQWSDRLPRLVQNRLVQTFENSGKIRAGRPGQGLAIDYQVVTDLRAFDYDAANKTAHVEISVKLMNDHDGKIVATQIFTGDGAVASDTAGNVTAALDQTLEAQMQAIVAWVVKRI